MNVSQSDDLPADRGPGGVRSAGSDIPPRLRRLVEEDGRRPIQQPAVQVDYGRWGRRLRGHADVVEALPSSLDRAAVRAFALSRSDDPRGAVAAFIATQVWGYGTTGYGPFRLAEALAHPDLPLALQTARTRLHAGQPVDAFRVLCVDHQIPWTGTSFGTKYLFFTDPLGRALILDSVVAGWLDEYAGLRLRGQRSDEDYAAWLLVAELWAEELAVPPERLELIIFSDRLRRGSSWKPRPSHEPAAAHAREASMTCADAVAEVLFDAGRSLRAGEIADEINRRGLYRRADGQPLPGYQVSSHAHANPQRFHIASGLIALNQDEAPHKTRDERGSDDAAVEPACVLVGCVSRKEPTARPAKELYRTQLFSCRRAYAEASGRPWLIVSALHGIIDPEEVIEPYDVRITDLSLEQRHALGRRVADQLEGRFGPLRDATFEVHAGDEYMQMLAAGPGKRGARLVNPLRGLRIGEQLSWYGSRYSNPPRPPASTATHRAPEPSQTMRSASGLARQITAAFQAGKLDLGDRVDVPPALGWAGMPEVVVAERMRASSASDCQVRYLLTFTAAMDRARDADALWFAAERMFATEPWTFSPEQITDRSLTELADVLRRFRVSQRHGPDAAAWRVIAESLQDPGAAPSVRRAVRDGRGDADELLDALQARSPGGTDRFPFLRGPKVGPMWVRMLAHPGGGEISSIDVLPVAVDVQVRKVTEYLAVTDTGNTDLDTARPVIQAAWNRDVSAHGTEGPAELAGSAAALDPALWFWGKWGCTRCERAGHRTPIGEPCRACRFPARA